MLNLLNKELIKDLKIQVNKIENIKNVDIDNTKIISEYKDYCKQLKENIKEVIEEQTKSLKLINDKLDEYEKKADDILIKQYQKGVTNSIYGKKKSLIIDFEIPIKELDLKIIPIEFLTPNEALIKKEIREKLKNNEFLNWLNYTTKTDYNLGGL